MKRIEGVSGCAACFSATDGVFVDMSAAFDGPVLENGMTIDDLILCEACVRKAFEVLDSDPDEVRAVEVENENLHAEVDRLTKYTKSLEASVALRPADFPKVKKTAKKAAA